MATAPMPSDKRCPDCGCRTDREKYCEHCEHQRLAFALAAKLEEAREINRSMRRLRDSQTTHEVGLGLVKLARTVWDEYDLEIP